MIRKYIRFVLFFVGMLFFTVDSLQAATLPIPQFIAPVNNKIYTEIPPVYWTIMENVSEYQVYIYCSGCESSPIWDTVTVQQNSLDFSSKELQNFLKKNETTVDNKVEIALYVRAKIDESYTQWSKKVQFSIGGKSTSKFNISVEVNKKGIATVYGYANQRFEEMLINVGNANRNPSITCLYTRYCVLLNSVRINSGIPIRGSFRGINKKGEEYKKDFYVHIPFRDSKAITGTIYPRENTNGTVTVYNHTKNNAVVNTIEIYIDKEKVAVCHNTYYCPYNHNSQESFEYGIRTYTRTPGFAGYVYFSGYKTYNPNDNAIEKLRVAKDVIYNSLDGTAEINISVDHVVDLQQINISVNGIDVKNCTYSAVCRYITNWYPDNTELPVRVNIIDIFGNKTYEDFLIQIKNNDEVVTSPSMTSGAVPIRTKIQYNNKRDVVQVEATTENNISVDRLVILVNARMVKECTNTNKCIAYINPDDLSQYIIYAVNSFNNEKVYWSGYKRKKL